MSQGVDQWHHDRTRPSRRRLGAITATLALLSTLLTTALTIAPATAMAQFNPIEDSYVQSSKPTNNYGTRTFMRVDATPIRYSFMKFDVQGAGPTTSAELDIYAQTSGDDIEAWLVTDNSWTESGITWNNAPPLDTFLDSTGQVSGGNWYSLDVSGAVSGDGIVTIALATTDNTSIRIGTRESSNPPVLHVPAPPPPDNPSPFVVTRSGSTYTAASQTTTESYTGSLKAVVEDAASSLQQHNGGVISFGVDTYDLGSEWLELDNIDDVEFAGAGIDQTFLVNNSSASTDTEPFDTVGSDRVIIRDMTVSAGGPARTTSDALDFDNGNDITVERVKITQSRGKGIVFDGKGSGWTSLRNTIRDCVIIGVPSDGIELLGASENVITGCVVTDAGGHGIQATKSSSSASQPNKKSSDNTISNNTVDNSGRDGININSSDRNIVTGNLITNSANVTSNRDGIRIESNNGVTCDDNEVSGNTATDNQSPKTQKYGLNISSSNCNTNVIGVNDFTGNLTGEIRDLGTNTIYDTPPDTEAPSVPGNVSATALSHFEVEVTWDASTDNVGVTGYTIWRDGNVLTTVGGGTTTFVDTTVAPLTTYDYTVDAFDAVPNTSAQSSPPANVTTPDSPGSVTVTPSHDAYVHGSNQTRNYGNSSQLRADASPDVVTYLQFDVAGLTGTVTSATLRIYAQSGSSVGVDARVLTDNNWDESTITYANAPGYGAVLDSSGNFSSGTWIELDVTSHVTGNGAVSLVVNTTHTTAVKFSSSEGSTAPELVITES